MRRTIIGNRRGFTLLEFMVASLIFSVLTIAAGSLFYFHGKLIKEVSQLTEKNLKSQFALNHILENVKGSAWVVVKSPNDLELHSHSNPDIREYHLLNDKLTFTTGNVSMIVVDGIQADNLFMGAGTVKNNGRFHKVKVEFWTKTQKNLDYHDKDVFYAQAYAAAQESWSILYVDPEHTAALQDGTKIRPFATLQQALDVVAPNDTIIVLSGVHTFTGDVNFGAVSFLYFAPASTLNIQGPATVTMGSIDVYQTFLLFDGKLNLFSAPGSRIKLTGGEWGWWQLYLTSPQETSDFQYLDFERGELSLLTQPLIRDRTPYNLTFANNTAYQAYLSVSGAVDVKAYNNTLSDGSLYLSSISGKGEVYNNTFQNGYLGYYQYTYTPNAVAQGLIHDNTYTGYGSISAYSYGSRASATLRMEIYNNSMQDGSISLGHYDYSGAFAQHLIYNNSIIRATSGNRFSYPIRYYSSGHTPNPDNVIAIQNNTINANYAIGGISISASDYSGSAVPKKIFVNNNVISNFYTGTPSDWYSSAGIYLSGGKFDIEINNNILTNGHTGVYVSDWQGPVTVTLKNNILSKLHFSALRSYSATVSAFNLINDTVVDVPWLYWMQGAPSVTINNCILWNTVPYSPYLGISSTYPITYSVTPYTSWMPGHGNVSANPNFVNPAEGDYSVKSASPVIDAGDPSIKDFDNSVSDMGAFGGPGALGWRKGSGAQ